MLQGRGCKLTALPSAPPPTPGLRFSTAHVNAPRHKPHALPTPQLLPTSSFASTHHTLHHRPCPASPSAGTHRSVFAQLAQGGEGILVGLAHLLNEVLHLGRDHIALRTLRLRRVLLLLVPVIPDSCVGTAEGRWGQQCWTQRRDSLEASSWLLSPTPPLPTSTLAQPHHNHVGPAGWVLRAFHD